MASEGGLEAVLLAVARTFSCMIKLGVFQRGDMLVYLDACCVYVPSPVLFWSRIHTRVSRFIMLSGRCRPSIERPRRGDGRRRVDWLEEQQQTA
jgi:hypothetical protein